MTRLGPMKANGLPVPQTHRQFNVLNSYFGINSIYKHWNGFQTIGTNCWSNVWKDEKSSPTGHSVSNYWPQNVWSPLEAIQTQEVAECLQNYNSIQWTTSFWNNINTAVHKEEVDNTIGYSSEFYRPLEPIGRPLERALRPHENDDITDGSIDSMTTPVEHKTPYIQPRIRRRLPTLLECVFCKNNNERPDFYKSHILKDPECKIQCPILRRYNCPICNNGGGDYAHTVRYCPLNKPGIQSKLERISRSHLTDVHKIEDWITERSVYSKNEWKKNRNRSRRALNGTCG